VESCHIYAADGWNDLLDVHCMFEY